MFTFLKISHPFKSSTIFIDGVQIECLETARRVEVCTEDDSLVVRQIEGGPAGAVEVSDLPHVCSVSIHNEQLHLSW